MAKACIRYAAVSWHQVQLVLNSTPFSFDEAWSGGSWRTDLSRRRVPLSWHSSRLGEGLSQSAAMLVGTARGVIAPVRSHLSNRFGEGLSQGAAMLVSYARGFIALIQSG